MRRKSLPLPVPRRGLSSRHERPRWWARARSGRWRSDLLGVATGRSGPPLVRRRVRYYLSLLGLVVVMFGAELAVHFTHGASTRWLMAAVALVAAMLALGSGLTLDDLGLSRATRARGLRYSSWVVAGTVAVIAIGLAVPPVREFFHNDAYRELGPALVSALVLIPVLTVIPEELLFRGVLLGALLRWHSEAAAIGVQALLFGLWHVVTSLGLSEGNRGIAGAVGNGPAGVALGILGAVVFTGAAGVVFGWLRVRTGSLLPGIALHWAANGAGAIASALSWQIG